MQEPPPAQHAAATSTVSKMQDTSTSPHASKAKRFLRRDESSLNAGSFRIAAGLQEEQPSSDCMAKAELGTARAGESPDIADNEDDIDGAQSDCEENMVRYAAEATAEQQASDMPSMCVPGAYISISLPMFLCPYNSTVFVRGFVTQDYNLHA